jgi:putative endonuclease
VPEDGSRGACDAQQGTRVADAGKRKLSVGRQGEEVAARYLERRGLTILERNWRGPEGELDIVARDGDTLVFVEVRTHRRPGPTHPSEWFPATKRRKLLQVAASYPKERDEMPCRFDVVGVVLGPGEPAITHLRDAFGEEPG